MSLDYTCYSCAKRRLTPQAILACAPQWHFEFIDADSSKRLPAGKPLPSYSLVWGCRSKLRDSLADLIKNKDQDGLDALSAKNLLGCCELEIEVPFEPEDEMLEDLTAAQGKMFARAASRYDTRSSAGQSDLSWLLQKAVCEAIARAASGLLEEPQEGTLRVVHAKV